MDKRYKNLIMKGRNLKESSMRSYNSHFTKIAKMIGVKYVSAKKVDENINKILQEIASMTISQKTALYSTLLIIFSPKGKHQPMKKYKVIYQKINELLKHNNNQYQLEKQKQMKTPKEKENWLAWDEIQKFQVNSEKAILSAWKMKKHVGIMDILEYQKLVILSLYVCHPPRRLDYSGMEIVDFDTFKKIQKLNNNIKKKNYLVVKSNMNKFFSFGAEANKSELKDGEASFIVKVNPPLNRVLNGWLQVNKGPPLLIDKKQKAMNTTQLSKAITSIFFKAYNKKIGTTMLRKIHDSFFFKTDTSYQMKYNLAKLMNHSVSVQQQIYVKKD